MTAIGELIFDEGVRWQGGFVKRAVFNGRLIGFRISPQLVSNHLPTQDGALDPMSLVSSNDAAVRSACVEALRRVGQNAQGGLINLLAEDFAQLGRAAGK